MTVNLNALSHAGTFNAAVVINTPGATGTVVPVQVTLPGIPSISVTPSQLSFAYQIGTATPPAQNLTLTSSTGSDVGVTASSKTTTCGAGWLVLSPSSVAAPGRLTVSVNVSGLTQGTCMGEIDIFVTSVSNQAIVVPVSLLVSNSPLIQVPSTGPTFDYQTPAAQNVQITSTTPGIAFTAAATATSGEPDFLQVRPASGTTPQALELTLNPTVVATLTNGTYTENVSIASTGAGNSPQSFPVTLVVSSNPDLISSVPSLNFNYQIGQPAPANQTITITSSDTPLDYRVSTNTTNCSGFLSATPASGSTFGDQNQIVVRVNTTSLTTPQLCHGSVVLTVPGISTPLQIPVTMNVSNSVLLNVSQSSLNVTALTYSTTPIQQTISVTSTDNSVQAFNAIAATNPPGLTWLSVAPQINGMTPQNLQVTINPTGLAVGVYSGSIAIQGTGSAASAPVQTIPVTLTIASAAVSVTPTSLTFVQEVGGPAPAIQSLRINGLAGFPAIIPAVTLFNGIGTWLTTGVEICCVIGGPISYTVGVSADGSQLPQGTYNGVVTVIVPGGQGSPLYIPVTLIVAAAPLLSASPATINFAFQFGTQVPATSQAVEVTSTVGTIAFIAGGSAFISVPSMTLARPATMSVALNPDVVAGLSPGSYSGSIFISSPTIPGYHASVNVNLTVTVGPIPVITSIANAGSLQPGPIAPGGIVTIFGSDIGPATPASGTGFKPTANGTVPTALAGATVTFNNVDAPLIFVSPNQINAIVPYEVASSSTASVAVQSNGATSASFAAQVVATSPAIFALGMAGNGQGAILNQDNTVNGALSPAAKGSIIQIFGTGEGQLVPGVSTGCITGLAVLPKPVATPVTVTIGGQPAMPITYAGEAPEEVCGVIQIDATVPANIGSGVQPVVLTIGTNSSSPQNITVAVQ